MKICNKCQTAKDNSEFTINKALKDGLAHYCRSCQNEILRANYWKNRERILERDRARWKVRSKSKSYLEQQAEKQRRARRNNPIPVRARAKVLYAIKTGKLVKEPCEQCGSTEKIQAHHEDYSRPLDVKWICFTCHRKLHGRFIRTF